MKKIKVVHVDDQESQQQTVKSILGFFDNVELTGQFDNALDAKEFILKNEVDLVILDVEMPGKDGLWLAHQLKNTQIFIVFLTAHPDYTLQAFEACAIHYILKPLTKTLLESVFERYEKLILNGKEKASDGQEEQINELVENYLNKTSYPRRIFINNVHKTTVINLSEVIYIVSKGQYTIFKTIDGAKHTSSKLLKVYFEALVNHPDFVRIHRAHIVNKNFVKAILRNKHIIAAEMVDGENLEVSPQKREEIYQLIAM